MKSKDITGLGLPVKSMQRKKERRFDKNQAIPDYEPKKKEKGYQETPMKVPNLESREIKDIYGWGSGKTTEAEHAENKKIEKMKDSKGRKISGPF